MSISIRKVSGIVFGIAWEKEYEKTEILLIFPFFGIVFEFN